MDSQTVLCVSHNLWLTREQRYALHRNNEVKVIGVSCPVWFDKGKTSEPASEIFCQYRLNTGNQLRIKQTLNGYDVLITNNSKPTDLPEFLWEMLSEREKETTIMELNKNFVGSKSLLDIKDGGSEWFAFKQYNKTVRQNVPIDVIHFVELKDMETLMESLV